MSEDSGRRTFIKRAGAVAWAVPAMSAVNMTGALAGGDMQTSVTDTTMRPTTTMATTTTAAPQPCTCTLSLVRAIPTSETGVAFDLQVSLSGLCNAPADLAEWPSPQNGGNLRQDDIVNGIFTVPLFIGALPVTIPITIYDENADIADTCDFTFTPDMVPPLIP